MRGSARRAFSGAARECRRGRSEQQERRGSPYASVVPPQSSRCPIEVGGADEARFYDVRTETLRSALLGKLQCFGRSAENLRATRFLFGQGLDERLRFVHLRT